MTSKERAVKIIAQLPEDVTVADIMEQLYVQMKVEQGLRQLDAGEGIDHCEVEKRMQKWLD